MFLIKSDKGRYAGLCASLQNQFSRGTNQYPTDLTDAYNMISTHKNENTKKMAPKKDANKDKDKNSNNDGENTQNGLSFLQHDNEVTPGNDGRVFANITCYKCKRKGHYKTSCPGTTKVNNVNAL